MGNSEFIKEAKLKIAAVRGRSLQREERAEEAIELAALFLQEAIHTQTSEEKKRESELAGMLNDAHGKAFTISMVDRCFRSQNASRIVEQLIRLLNDQGIPKYLPKGKKIGLWLFKKLGPWLPGVFVSLLRTLLRSETSSVILPGEEKQLLRHIARRTKDGIRINLNHLGEAILGEKEAERRLEMYLHDLSMPEIEYISVKITTVYSQINLLAWESTLEVLSEKLRRLLRAARQFSFIRADGVAAPKFVNLDMEEYRDLRLTVDLFKKVLDEPEFHQQSAGIVLQSYLPDSFFIQQELTQWAIRRKHHGGAPIKIRIVKGANLAMEQVEAAMKCWPQAPYPQKISVDANFKRMLSYGMQKENASAVHLGVASHNLFDISYACLLRAENEVEPFVVFEMLEGMADHLRRVVQKFSEDMLLYCPAATRKEFQHALAYLVRRLDENTAPANFLRHVFDLKPGTKAWGEQAALFKESVLSIETESVAARRTQNRLLATSGQACSAGFENEADTDWALLPNRLWAEQIAAQWIDKPIVKIPLVIDGQEVDDTQEQGKGFDPSRPGKEIYTYCLADQHLINQALEAAKKACEKQALSTPKQRADLLIKIAEALRKGRGRLIGVMIADTGKTIPEADVEVSEAIDFAEYYARNIEEIYGLQDLSWQPKGTVLVAPPWNFPCSITAGGLLAAIAAGNAVLLKPAPEAIWVGWELAQIFWEAGVDRSLLQFIVCQDEPVGSALVKDPRVHTVLLTGATDTAKLFLKMRPGIDLYAETGGKNAIVVSAVSDRDLAIKDIIHSAFGHAGQKCSACSLVILEAEVYDDAHFMAQLRDGAASLKVGSAWDLSTKVNPLIRPPAPPLLRALTQLEEGEVWLLEPAADPENPNIWSPGIKLGVKPNSFMHQTELFGPVLGVMRAQNLQEAFILADSTPYGLTGGIHSLEEAEIAAWQKSVEVGNYYINRTITGAIVQRQPFGGCKGSSFGGGAKAGGPNYLMQLLHPHQEKLPTEREKLSPLAAQLTSLAEKKLSPEDFAVWQASLGSYAFFWTHYFSKSCDLTKLMGQDNILSYTPRKNLCIRLQKDDSLLDLWRIAAALATVGMNAEISLDSSLLAPLEDIRASGLSISWFVETEEEWAKRVKEGHHSLRLLSTPSLAILTDLADRGAAFQVSPVFANGRLELLKFLREISISKDYHRYGNLGLRENEKRKALALSEEEKLMIGCSIPCCSQ